MRLILFGVFAGCLVILFGGGGFARDILLSLVITIFMYIHDSVAGKLPCFMFSSHSLARCQIPGGKNSNLIDGESV